MIRVGTRVGSTDPSYEGFEKIVVLMKSHSKWGVIGPYLLKNEEGHIFENIWQFSKAYETVPDSCQYYSRYNKTVTWKWPAERHMKVIRAPDADNPLTADDYEILPAYWTWRKAGMKNEYFVRYPVSFDPKIRASCKFSLWPNENGEYERLDYIQARKKIYSAEYKRLVRKQSLYQELLTKLRTGTNLLIVEVDGPKQESLQYYKDKYNVSNDFIESNTMLVTRENLDIMVNDSKHAYGHGYCLAEALLEDIGEL